MAKGKEIEQEEKIEKSVKGEKIIRILETDVSGGMQVYPALAKIKGVSWSFSNAICNVLKIDKKKKIGDITDKEIKEICEFIKNPKLPNFLLNRRKDLNTGENLHLVGSDLNLRKEFDIKRLKKIKSYRGLRHALGQPVRGQRTRSHFRTNKSIGVVKKGKK